MCGWLRPSCAYLKRLAGRFPIGWDEAVLDSVLKCCHDLAHRLVNDGPAHGVWHADPSCGEWKAWCDASSLAIATVLSQDDKVIEDGRWLGNKFDKRHINVAELEASLKALDMAIRWHIKKVRIMTNLKTVAGWLRSVRDNTHRVKVGGLRESLVRLCLQVFEDTVSAACMDVSVEWIRSEANLADPLTRVPSSWPSCSHIDGTVAVYRAVLFLHRWRWNEFVPSKQRMKRFALSLNSFRQASRSLAPLSEATKAN